MKTLQEQYNLIKKGKGHKDVFLKEAKRLFPNIVPNAAGFKQTSKLLKQRSIINENVFPLITSKGLNPFTSFNKFLSEEAKATEKKTTKEINEKETTGYDYKDPKNLDNQIFDQYLKGLRFEMEQNSKLTREEATEIVAKNLVKDSLFYMNNAAFGIDGLGYTTSTEPKEPTGKYKSSGYGDLKENNMNKSTQLKELLEEAVAGIPSIGNPFADRKKASYEDKFAAFLLAEENKKEDTKEAKEPTDEAEEVKEAEPKMEEKASLKEKKKLPETFIKEVEELSKRAANEVAVKAYTGKINSLKETLSTINEDENLAEFIDENKTKAVQAEIDLYEKYCNKSMQELEYSQNNNK